MIKHRVLLQAGYVEFADLNSAENWRDLESPASPIETVEETLPQEDAEPHHILKDTIVQRVKEAGKLEYLKAMIDSLSPLDRFEWDNSTWFHSNNAMLLQGVAALDLDSDTILAPDPLAP